MSVMRFSFNPCFAEYGYEHNYIAKTPLAFPKGISEVSNRDSQWIDFLQRHCNNYKDIVQYYVGAEDINSDSICLSIVKQVEVSSSCFSQGGIALTVKDGNIYRLDLFLEIDDNTCVPTPFFLMDSGIADKTYQFEAFSFDNFYVLTQHYLNQKWRQHPFQILDSFLHSFTYYDSEKDNLEQLIHLAQNSLNKKMTSFRLLNTLFTRFNQQLSHHEISAVVDENILNAEPNMGFHLEMDFTQGSNFLTLAGENPFQSPSSRVENRNKNITNAKLSGDIKSNLWEFEKVQFIEGPQQINWDNKMPSAFQYASYSLFLELDISVHFESYQEQSLNQLEKIYFPGQVNYGLTYYFHFDKSGHYYNHYVLDPERYGLHYFPHLSLKSAMAACFCLNAKSEKVFYYINAVDDITESIVDLMVINLLSQNQLSTLDTVFNVYNCFLVTLEKGPFPKHSFFYQFKELLEQRGIFETEDDDLIEIPPLNFMV